MFQLRQVVHTIVPRATVWREWLLTLCLLGLPGWERVFAIEHSIPFVRLSIEQGLSQAAVNAIVQDRVGYLWIGTQEGLNRYDGYEFTTVSFADAEITAILRGWIQALLVDDDGALWVGTKRKRTVED